MMPCKYLHNLSFPLRKKSIKNTDVYSPNWSVSLNKNGKNCFLRMPLLLLWHFTSNPPRVVLNTRTSVCIHQDWQQSRRFNVIMRIESKTIRWSKKAWMTLYFQSTKAALNSHISEDPSKLASTNFPKFQLWLPQGNVFQSQSLNRRPW